MNVIAFLFFLAVAVYYVWNGKDFYKKKDWVGLGKKFIAVLIGVVILAFVLKGLVEIIPGFSNNTAGDLMEKIGMSFIMVLGMKFLIVMLCAIFSRIMDFHRIYNAKNYQKFSPLTIKVAPALLIVAKCIVSLGSVVIYYGIWLAH
ncbi:hypothetical protein [Erwinia sp. E_sp_B04_7]|uniref:hypothetical protein n=1 Tax=unclassified Erwinia TaxID=2622719 RepID=UPI0030D06C89